MVSLLGLAALGCQSRQPSESSLVDDTLNEFVSGARIGATYGEAMQRIASLTFGPNSSTSPGGEIPGAKLGFRRFSLRLGLPSYESSPDSSETVRWIELWSPSRASADSVGSYLTTSLGVIPDTICLEFQGRPRSRVVRWQVGDAGAALETPLGEELNYSRLVFFGGNWDRSEHHVSEGRVGCGASTARP